MESQENVNSYFLLGEEWPSLPFMRKYLKISYGTIACYTSALQSVSRSEE